MCTRDAIHTPGLEQNTRNRVAQGISCDRAHVASFLHNGRSPSISVSYGSELDRQQVLNGE